MSQRLEQIKARDLTILKGTKFYDDFIWLIQQAEIQQEKGGFRMNERLREIENKFTPNEWFEGWHLSTEDIEWLIEQAEKAEEYKSALENIANELGRGYPE